jgi:hypothetical protein
MGRFNKEEDASLAARSLAGSFDRVFSLLADAGRVPSPLTRAYGVSYTIHTSSASPYSYDCEVRLTRLTVRRPESDHGDLGTTVKAEAGVDDPEAAVGILIHLSHFVEPAWVLVYKRRYEREPQARE